MFLRSTNFFEDDGNDQKNSPSVKIGIDAGETPRDFILKDPDGIEYEFYDFVEDDSKSILLEFTLTNCIFCQRMAPVMHELYENYSVEVDFITVVSGSSNESVKFFQQFYNQSWPCLVDRLSEIAKEWDLVKFPTFFVIDNEGKISWSEWESDRGSYTYDELAAKLDAVS
jgi:peroxiredoxin